jgi:hypothetical protein
MRYELYYWAGIQAAASSSDWHSKRPRPAGGGPCHPRSGEVCGDLTVRIRFPPARSPVRT